MTFDVSEFSLLGGLLLGLASSLHCAGMCGGIASGLAFMFPAESKMDRARVLLVSQFGRIASYCIAGGLVGYFGSGIFGIFDQSTAFLILQSAAALTLVWIGLSVAGILPPLSALDRLASPIMVRLMPAVSNRSKTPAPFFAGMLWGLMPCAMVYGALFTAMLTGSMDGGIRVMAGFGLGTIPAVTLTAFGITSLKAANTQGMMRGLVGLTIAAIGMIGIATNTTLPQVLCLI